MNFVSIILPYYKKKKFIQKTIKSIQNQSYGNFELIIVYDDEELEDLAYVKRITNKDKRIKIIINRINIGAGLSRNKAIKNSKGNYLAFIDGDDTWQRDKLKLQINFMKKNKYEISHTAYNIINFKDQKISLRTSKNLKYNDLIKSCDVGLSTVMLKKKLITKNLKFPSLKTKEDYFLWLKLSKKNTFYYLDYPLTNWRKLNNSLSSSTLQKVTDSIRLYLYFEKSFFKSVLRTIVLIKYFLKKK